MSASDDTTRIQRRTVVERTVGIREAWRFLIEDATLTADDLDTMTMLVHAMECELAARKRRDDSSGWGVG